MKRCLTTLLLCTISSVAFSQSNAISGSITLSDSITALQGVHVYLENTGYATASNGIGNYNLSNVPDGEYTLVFASIGFTTHKQVVSLHNNATLQVNICLPENIEMLHEVQVMTKGTNSLKGIPGSVQYISPREIERFSYSDVNRTLRMAPGVNIQEEDGYGLRPNIGLRGTGVDRSAKITIMEDGVLMAPAPYADPSAYYFPTIGRMQGIEILKGSSQIKYGPFTTGGAINLISTPIPDAFSGRFHLMGGSYGARNIHAFAGNSHEHIGYVVETFQYSADGFKELDNGGNTGFNKEDYMAKLRFNTGEKARFYQSLTLKAGQATEQSDETYLGLTADDFNATPFRRYAASQVDNMQTTQNQYSATHHIAFTQQWRLTTTAYATDFSRNWYKLDKVMDSTGVKTGVADILEAPAEYHDAYAILTGQSSTVANALFVKANNRTYYAKGVQSQMDYHVVRGMFKHDVVAGVRFHMDGIDRFQWEDQYAMDNGIMELTTSGTPGTESNRIKTAQALAAYAQYQLSYGKWTFVPGVRFESIDLEEKDYGKTDPDRLGTDLSISTNSADVVIPGIGIDYAIQKAVHVFAGVHKGFSPPGAGDETLPEESINYELGTRYSKKALLINATVFVNDYSNLLGSDLAATGGTGSGDMFNAGEVLTKGLELQLGYDLLSYHKHARFSIPVAIAYTYTDATFETDFAASFEDWGEVNAGDAFPYLSNHQLNAMIGCATRTFSVHVNTNYLSDMRMVPGQGTIPENELIPARTILDLSANYQMNTYLSVFANVLNAANNTYIVAGRPAGLRPGLPRTVNMGMKMNF